MRLHCLLLNRDEDNFQILQDYCLHKQSIGSDKKSCPNNLPLDKTNAPFPLPSQLHHLITIVSLVVGQSSHPKEYQYQTSIQSIYTKFT